jgi:hypothetical protein
MGHGSPRVESVIPVQRAKEREKLKSAVHSVVVPEPWVCLPVGRATCENCARKTGEIGGVEEGRRVVK